MIFINTTILKLACGLVILVLLLSLVLPWGIQQFLPLKYWDEIEFYAVENGLDPFLVAAIIKVESKFDSQAKSKRGAKGLMQLMPETAGWIAEQNGLQYEEKFLYDPEYNIRLGCWYLNSLSKQFENNLPLILAAYNGGRGNVKKWLDNNEWTGQLSDIENIPFSETRNFVVKVFYNYKFYKLYYKNF